MFNKIKLVTASALVLAVFGFAAGAYIVGGSQAQASDDQDMVSVNSVHKFLDGSAVDDSSSVLVRTEDSITATLKTEQLTRGHAYTMWWVIFNNPEECQHGVPGLTTCGEGDVFGQPFGQTPVQVSVQYAAGNVIGRTGMGGFGAHLNEGELPAADGQLVFGPGLIDSEKAEVHLVIRDHGWAIRRLEMAQITTFGGACTSESDPTGIGPAGPWTCKDVQFAAHLPGGNN